MKSFLLLLAACLTFVASVAVHGRASAAQTAAGGATPRGPASSEAGLAIINRSCTSCHDAGQIKQARRPADWQPIIDRMRSNGATISDGDAKILLDYLIKNYSSRP